MLVNRALQMKFISKLPIRKIFQFPRIVGFIMLVFYALFLDLASTHINMFGSVRAVLVDFAIFLCAALLMRGNKLGCLLSIIMYAYYFIFVSLPKLAALVSGKREADEFTIVVTIAGLIIILFSCKRYWKKYPWL